MWLNKLNNLSNRALAKIKWGLTALSGLLTAGLIIVLES